MPRDSADYWPQTADDDAVPTYLTVRVHQGDTLSAIAARYSVSLTSLTRLNELSDADDIYAGEELRLPADSRATRAAVIEESSWRSDPAAALRGLAKVDSPSRARCSFTFVKPAIGR